VIHLKDMYGKVVEGEGTPLIGAKSIVTSSMHFYRNNGELNVPVSTKRCLYYVTTCCICIS
jgi:hypothetical protein